MEQIGYAAILHDIGKINVPKEILNKKDRLTKEEYDIIKKHSHDGDKIIQEARIICIADAYDAMTSDRPYRKGMSKEDAIQELNKNKGKHFDSMIVDVFIEILNSVM